MDQQLDLRDFDGRVRLFPLPGVVLFPHAVLPLHIFEPRYREMTRDALASDKLVTIVQVRPESSRSGGKSVDIEPVACLGRILSHERLPDGRFNFLLLGRKRVRIVRELVVNTLYRQAEVEILEDLETSPEKETKKVELIQLYRDVARRADGLDPELDRLFDSEPPLGVITDLLSQALGLPASVKQSLLADCRVDHRAESLERILRKVADQLDGSEIHREFPPRFSDN